MVLARGSRVGVVGVKAVEMVVVKRVGGGRVGGWWGQR